MPDTDAAWTSEQANYRGPLVPGEVCSVLQSLDVLLFPTWYEGEGMPGIVIEALPGLLDPAEES